MFETENLSWSQTSTSLAVTLILISPFLHELAQFAESSKTFHKSEHSIMSLAFTLIFVIYVCYMSVI